MDKFWNEIQHATPVEENLLNILNITYMQTLGESIGDILEHFEKWSEEDIEGMVESIIGYPTFEGEPEEFYFGHTVPHTKYDFFEAAYIESYCSCIWKKANSKRKKRFF